MAWNYLILVALLSITVPVVQSACMSPPPAKNFNATKYYGVWYEVGKIQTAGGGYFEKDCVCTAIDISATQGGSNGDSTAINSCRKLTVDGQFLNATGNLTEMSPPGKWKEQFFSFVPKVDYTVIYMDDNFAVEYDCSVFAGIITNYCIHVMARGPNANMTAVAPLVKMAEGMGLNSDHLNFTITKQDNCWKNY